jgi:hypothetical protein
MEAVAFWHQKKKKKKNQQKTKKTNNECKIPSTKRLQAKRMLPLVSL